MIQISTKNWKKLKCMNCKQEIYCFDTSKPKEMIINLQLCENEMSELMKNASYSPLFKIVLYKEEEDESYKNSILGKFSFFS